MVNDTKESLTDGLKINGHRKEDKLLEEQTRLLELIASGKPLDECLSALCSAIPRLNPGVRASVLVADEHRKAFKRPIAPELLPSFGEGLEGAPINDLCIGTCGEAVFSGEQIICEDIKNDDKWAKEWRDLCVANGVLACQSTPVLDNDGNARASFMLCFDETRTANEWEQRLSEFGAHIINIALEREQSAKALRESRDRLAVEVDSMQHIQEISTQMIKEDNAEALYEQLLDAAMAIMHSDFASMQLFYPDRGDEGELKLLGFRGFNPEAAKFWEWVTPTSESTCGMVLRTGERCIVPDVKECDFMDGSEELETYLQTGIHAVQTTPLFSRNGQILGMISTHWSDPHQPSENELRLLDVLARQAAELMERAQSEDDLRENKEHFQLAVEVANIGTWNYDIETDLVYLDEHMCEIWGTTQTIIPLAEVVEHIHSGDREQVTAAITAALDPSSGGTYDVEYRIVWDDSTVHWVSANGQVQFSGEERKPVGFFGTALDITGRKQAEKRANFRAALTDALRSLEDPEAIKNEATRVLGEYLGVSRALYADVEEDGMYISVKQNYVNGVSPVTGRFRLNDFGRELMDDIRTGMTLTVSDIADFNEEPRLQDAERSAYDAVGVRAYAAIPLVKDGKLVAYLGFHQSEPRKWADDEIALMEETAERTWDAVERARAERQIQRSEYRYRTLFESIDEGYCIIRAVFDEAGEPVDYKVVEVNPAAKRQIGLSEMKDMEDKNPQEILPEQKDFSYQTYGKVVLTREPVRFEKYAEALDRYFSVSVYPYGQPEEQKAVVIFSDITDRKHAEQALLRTNERLKAVLKGSEVGAWESNLETGMAWYSPEYDRIFGYDSLQSNWAYEKFMEHVLPEDRERVDRRYRDILNGREKLDLEFRIRRADGEKRWVWSHGQIIRDKDTDSAKRVIGTIQDITERKRAEMHNRFLADLSKELQAISDPEEITAATARMLGEHLEADRCAYAEVEGDEDSFVITGDYTRGDMLSIVGNWQMSAFGSEALRLMREDEPYVVDDVDKDKRITDADREAYEQTKIDAVICVPLHKAGRFVAGMAIHQKKPRHWLPDEVELTVQVANRCWEAIERARINRDLQEMNENLEERVDERTSALLSYQKQLRWLATRLSKAEEEERRRLATELHDNLGQMLAVTKMKIDLMKKTESLADLTEASELMDEAIIYTRELMSDLKPPPQLGEEDISANLGWLAKKMKKYDLNVMFESVEVPEPLDEHVQTTLVQAVRELLFNVVKHAGSDEARMVLSFPDDHLKITVKDNGSGFDTNNINTDLSKGGFGLFNIRERIDLLGGRTEIESVPGKGTTVTLIVPLTAGGANMLSGGESSQKPQGAGLPGKQNQPKIKVLLVDDHEMMREGLKKIIEQEHDLTVVAEAPDGQSAVDLAHEVRPDVVIMDINLPGMNGIDATEKIKGELPDVRVIGLSLHNDDKVKREMRNAGASAYLNKSNAFETLCATIRSEGMTGSFE